MFDDFISKKALDSWLNPSPFLTVPDPYGPEAAKSRLEEEKRLRSALGYAQTILTSPGGLGLPHRFGGAKLGGGL